jgi:hypothetical protein
MRLIVTLRASALVLLATGLFGCPNKDGEVSKEPSSLSSSQPSSDKAGAAEPAAPAPKEEKKADDKDKGGW